MSDKVEQYVLVVEFQAFPLPASLFRNMVENTVDHLIATNGLKVKGPIELMDTSEFRVVQNSATDNTERVKCSECGSAELEYIRVECQDCGHEYECNASPVS